jgi:NAD-dependent deacetylase
VDLAPLLARAAEWHGPIVVLTGAGISAESGIPTFRGPEGYWRVGSRNYRPEELATLSAFQRLPAEIWGWYLYRRGVCLTAEPNPAHRALVRLEAALLEQFQLVTQNVDGLHLRAGNSRARTWQIHGNLHFMRCGRDCAPVLMPIPDALPRSWEKDRVPDAAELELLRCPACGAATRPHVLWFDECYDERSFHSESALQAAHDARLLVVVGTSGTTTLPMLMAQTAARDGTPMVVVDVEESRFSELARHSAFGVFIRGRAGEVLPELVQQLMR